MDKQEIISIAEQAYDVIKDGNQWCRGKYAKDKLGLFVYPWSTEACCWCSLGAVQKVIDFITPPEGNTAEKFNVMVKILKPYFDYDIPRTNDSETHAQVCQRWQNAINGLKNECSS